MKTKIANRRVLTRFLLLASAACLGALSACGGGGGGSGAATPIVSPTVPATGTPSPDPTPTPTPTPTTVSADPMVASDWEIGPVINGKNYSVGMPAAPTQTLDGWAFDFPCCSAPASVGYVTFHHGSLTGKTHIVMDYRVEMDPGVTLHPTCCAEFVSVGPTIYFQQKNDNWTQDGLRWWATFNSPYPIQAGTYHMDVPLDGAWTSMSTMTAATDPQQFATAKSLADRVGFTFGGGTGYGHGVYADGRARFIVTSFKVE